MPVLFNQYGLNEIWDEEYAARSASSMDHQRGRLGPLPLRDQGPDPLSLEDLKGKRVFTFPTAGRFLSQFGVVPVTLPWEDIEVAVQTGELGRHRLVRASPRITPWAGRM